jgi:anion-transporting  ArsA/GET3 family ATPase
MAKGFKDRSQRVMTMLRESQTSFLLICAPEPSSLAEVDRFFRRLAAEALTIGGVIINRVHQADSIFAASSYSLTNEDVELISTLPDRRLGGVDLASRLLAAFRDQLTMAALDRAAIDATDWIRAQVPMHRVPHFDRDLHSLADVAAFAAQLQIEAQTTTATAPT